MHHDDMKDERKSFYCKVAFFLIMLFLVGMTYLENGLMIDAFYFCTVLTLFIRFLILKLYQ